MVTYENKKSKLIVYTRKTNEKSYPNGLARSIHFAVSRDGQYYQPLLSFYSIEGEFGPGHNSFFVDVEGNLMLAYHAEDALESRLRSDGIHRIHFDVYGMPRFDLSAERDLNPSLREVSIQVILSNGEGGLLKGEDTKLYTNTARG